MSDIVAKLLAAKVISHGELALIQSAQQHSNAPIRELICDLGLVSESVLAQVLSTAPSVDLKNHLPSAQALALIDVDFARRMAILPLNIDGDTLSIASNKPADLLLIDQVRAHIGMRYQVKAFYCESAAILAAIDQFYGHELAISAIMHELDHVDSQSSAIAQGDYRHPIIRLNLAILHEALRLGASDIHFEPEAQFMRLRVRIDGVLRQIQLLPRAAYMALCVRIKVMANLDIANSKALQDGNFSLQLAGRDIDVRVAIMPTQYGENIVLRLLDKKAAILDFADMGLEGEDAQQLEQLMARPSGLILLTGPTGSGKTTTLYSMLAKINHFAVNIMTLEDPIEYKLPLLRQSALNHNMNLDFESGVRAIMRQDPDVILIGEIRDAPTATMALRAALTGHQVYSTLHCQSALSAHARLMDMGVSAPSLRANISGIIAQRLLRQLCPHCQQSHSATEAECQLLQVPSATLKTASGCPACAHTGYKGRFAVMEIVRVDATVEAHLLNQEYPQAAAYMRAQGFVPLATRGKEAVLKGRTSLAELQRVIDIGTLHA